jgi:hypothetical protein
MKKYVFIMYKVIINISDIINVVGWTYTAHTPFPYQTNATIYVATLSNFVLGESEKLG